MIKNYSYLAMQIKVTMTIMQCKTDSPYLNKNGSNSCRLSLACAPIPQHCKKKELTKICET